MTRLQEIVHATALAIEPRKQIGSVCESGLPITVTALKLKKEIEKICLVLPEKGEEIAEDLKFFLKKAYFLPPWDPSPETIHHRLEAIKKAEVLIVDAETFLESHCPSSIQIELYPGKKLSPFELVQTLEKIGYTVTSRVWNPAEVCPRGGVVDVFGEIPVRIEFFGNTVESIRKFNPETNTSVEELSKINLPAFEENTDAPLFEKLSGFEFVYYEEEFLKQHAEEKGINPKHLPEARFSITSANADYNYVINPVILPKKLDFLIKNIKELQEQGYRVSVSGSRLAFICEELPGVEKLDAELTKGFIDEQTGYAIVSEGDIIKRKKSKPVKLGDEIRELHEIKPGDLVVHVDFGIGKFKEIKNMKFGETKKDYIVIEYRDGDLLYVPAHDTSRVYKYVGLGEAPELNKLGDKSWERRLQKVRNSIQKIAKELLELYAFREHLPGYSFSKDTPWQLEFEAVFPYEETEDQIRAIEEVKKDMESAKPMDRVICGDVGFGKTEVAMRAAFKAVMDGKQVAVLVPTTPLAWQHYKTFSERFSKFPIIVEVLYRLQKPSQQKKIIKKLAEGKIDIIIGTHRLLQKDIKFRDLGLLIIDEEHLFGVRHKERLRQLKKQVDTLTLTATPIPRTLYMALSGLRDISVIYTPPPGRKSIVTRVLPFSEEKFFAAIKKELERGGQIFVVNDKIKGLEQIKAKIQKAFPEVEIGLAHGRLPREDLEKTLMKFLQGEYQILVATIILEAGLDFPNVNTLIILNAHNFGLAQLYQLRGRVGRRDVQAYAYLFYDRHIAAGSRAYKRLKALAQFQDLGSSFKLALYDLEMRGAGNLLGFEQSGNIATVGISLYMDLLKQAIKELKGEKIVKEYAIDIQIDSYPTLPDSIPAEERIQIYREIFSTKNEEELQKLAEKMKDMLGPLFPQAEEIIKLQKIKLLASKHGIKSIKQEGNYICLDNKKFKIEGKTLDYLEKIIPP